MEVILKVYTTEQCPVVPFDAAQAAHVGERWKHIETIPVTYNGQVYNIMNLESRFPTTPPTGLQWPEKYASIAFSGGISKMEDNTALQAEATETIIEQSVDNGVDLSGSWREESEVLTGEPEMYSPTAEESNNFDYGGGDGGGAGASGEY